MNLVYFLNCCCFQGWGQVVEVGLCSWPFLFISVERTAHSQALTKAEMRVQKTAPIMGGQELGGTAAKGKGRGQQHGALPP